MVLLTMTPSIVEALEAAGPTETPQIEDHDEAEQEPSQPTKEPSLDEPEIGKPISHDQIVDLWKRLKAQGSSNYTLEQLLRGASVYIPPPPPKPEPSPEYKALMARLRREEEARTYERMINPPPPRETFKDHFPHSAASFASANRPTSAADPGDDDAAMEEVHKQVTLIINFLVSIAGVAGTLWVTARWWSLPSRLFLTMGGSILVAIAEVVVYNAYMWKMEEGRKKHGKVKEVREVVESWVLGKDEDEKTVLIKGKDKTEGDGVRKRRTEPKVETSESPAPSVPRSRAKPLRTYGKRSIRDDSPKEPNTKKRRISTEVTSSESSASKNTDKAAQSPPNNVAEASKNTPEPTATDKSTINPIKKGSILSFFKPLPPSYTVASSPKSDEPQPEATPPSSPPQPARIETRKKPRLLRFRGTSLSLLDDETTGDDTQGDDTETEEGTKSTGAALRERESSTSNTKSGKRGKPKTPTVQTTLNISNQAAFSECKAGNGCITCRIRRVKCDLAKPECQRCQTSKRQCDGYLPEDSTVTRRQLAQAARQISTIGPISQAFFQFPRDRSRSVTPPNLSFFDVFRTLTAPSTASFIPSQFWTRELLQLAHCEPAVWHATLALGALHQRHELAWQGHGYRTNDTLSSQAWDHYGHAIAYAREVKEPTRLLALSLALVSITNMMGRWLDSSVHILAGHRLLKQAGQNEDTSSAAEILTRLDLLAMTFSDSTSPYPYKQVPRMVWIDEVMRKTSEITSYAQAGTALYGLMRRLMMLSETTAIGLEEEAAARDFEMLQLTVQDLMAWEYKMGQFEKEHPNPHDEKGAVGVRLYHTLLRVFLAGGGFGPETRWDAYLGYYERIMTLAETLWSHLPSSHARSPLSLESGLIVPIFMVAQRCRHPWLRRRAISFLFKIKRQEGPWFSGGAAAVCQRIMEIEGQKYFDSDLAREDSPSPISMEDVPWEEWAEIEELPARLSWAGIERVPELERVRETLVVVNAEEKSVELSFIMSSGDDVGSFGQVRSETVMYGHTTKRTANELDTMDTLVKTVNATAEMPLNPYWPLNAALPHYAPNTLSSRALVASFVVGATIILGVTLSLIQQSRRKLSKFETFVTLWFALCGFIHLFFEGYFAVNFADIANRQFLFAQLWKEYSLSDSRYLTQDSFLVPMEAITAFLWGPMSFFCAWSIVKEHPLRHPVQLIISVGQIYGDILYFGTCYFNEVVRNIVYCRPEQFYFYMYYIFCNAIWIVIPTVLVIHSVVATKRAFAKVQAAEKMKKGL
ncbi:hypothetical protein F53441_6337 [Fusarium austroafricanum]|uniref:Zn(2)-C6 fungal-type domain-containing protein n=1 Tax=Fusarium austroafricanum TaxID=2364996 RepID=A0A8H4P764_9HYPO|nr:hypothetical protein F53441_6337 [Fusarium austroafricanum]